MLCTCGSVITQVHTCWHTAKLREGTRSTCTMHHVVQHACLRMGAAQVCQSAALMLQSHGQLKASMPRYKIKLWLLPRSLSIPRDLCMQQ
jgi:hypothetical protein